ncbi:DUF4139 domain-containing protein [Roseibium sp. RKSG952]|uniref:DUF4139 domain-containing protein n=1 Tax=Roseibium sp. RKSG952 TaxID=2529384 RepID=UPI0012BD5FD3|nr:DUF4139 domain-containing protein [Roseibium sp. RKSG952]MTH94924.1 DUF4139 domain-containing protein [Roseibium sp. RKSG952]
MKSLKLAVALTGALLSSSALASENGDITNITMSSGGLAEIVRKATISEDGIIKMEVPIEQVDDVLKSVVVFDGKGAVEGMSLPGPSPLSETFKKLPFTVDDLQSPAMLLSTLQGAQIEIQKSGSHFSGRVLGVSSKDNGETGREDVASILTKEGNIVSVALDSSVNISFKDIDVREKIANALSVVGDGKVGGAREISIRIAGDGQREVAVSYVVPAPIWKTAYRVVTQDGGKARLQAWAVLENASGEDWKGVNVTLSSGEPVTLKQKLHSLYWKQRAEVPIDTSAGYVPPVDPGAAPPALLEKREHQWAAARSANGLASMSMMDTEENVRISSANVGQATEGNVTASFEIPWLVDLKNGQTLSAPIIDDLVEAEEVSVFRPESGSMNPVAAIMLVNDTGTSLPKGILTVYDDKEGYVGDAQISGMPDGERRMASFATDKKVLIETSSNPTEEITEIKVVDGILTAVTLDKHTTQYAIKGAADAERTVVIEQAKRPGWEFSSDHELDSTKTHRRMKITVPAGETKMVTAVVERTRNQIFHLSQTDTQTLLSLSSRYGIGATTRKLTELAILQKERSRIEYQMNELNRERDRHVSDQGRQRANLQSVPQDSPLFARSMQKLEDSETVIEKIDGTIKVLNRKIADIRTKIGDAIRNF